MKRVIRLSMLALVVASGPGASAQTMGSTVKSFNLLGDDALTLTGFSPTQPLNINVAGTSPGLIITKNNATIREEHINDAAAIAGQAEGLALWNSLLAPANATIIPLAAATLPPSLNVGPGVTIYTAAANVTNSDETTTITGSPSSIVIFQVTTFLTLTNTNIILAGGMAETNVYWQVNDGITVINNDALNRAFPGTAINNTNARDIVITCSGAGALGIGRQLSLQGSITMTQSGAGVLTANFPEAALPTLDPSSCSDGFLFPSPAIGATAKFVYCMEAPGTVTIKVYNVIGDLAAKIEDTRGAGTQSSTLSTNRLAPGVYLYMMERNYGGGHRVKGGVKKFVVKH